MPYARDTANRTGLPDPGTVPLANFPVLSWADEVEVCEAMEQERPAAVCNQMKPSKHALKGSSAAAVRRGSLSSDEGIAHGNPCPARQGCPPNLLRAVMHALQEGRPCPEDVFFGWFVLEHTWGLRPSDFDRGAQETLQRHLPPALQQHLLLAFACLDLSNVQNLSAYFVTFISNPDGYQLCLYSLVGSCAGRGCCVTRHTLPHPMWPELHRRCGVLYTDLDYAALNSLLGKDPAEQAGILRVLCRTDLSKVNNLSAYLSKVVLSWADCVPAPRAKYSRVNSVAGPFS